MKDYRANGVVVMACLPVIPSTAIWLSYCETGAAEILLQAIAD